MIWNILLVIVIMACVVGYFYSYVVKIINEREMDSFNAIASKTASQYDTFIYNMDKTALQIAANPQIVRYFSIVNKDMTTNYFIEEPVIASQIVQLLNSYNFKKDSNARINLYNNYNDFIYTSSVNTTFTAMESFFSSDHYKSVKDYFNQDDVYSMQRPPQKDFLNDSKTLQSPDMFSIIREIKDYTSNSLKNGYVEVQQSVERINEVFGDLGQDSFGVVIDKDYNIIYKSSNLADPSDIAALQQYIDLAKQEGWDSATTSIAGKFLTNVELQETNGRVLFLKNQSTILKPLMQFRTLLIIVSVILLLVVIIAETAIVRYLTRPLKDLYKSIKKVSIHNLELDTLTYEKNDEIQQINIAFDRMLQRLNSSIQNMVEAKTNELQSHLFALQSQMNPHFIHNILAIISMEAQEFDHKKIMNICSKLSRMLHFSSSMGDGFCSASDELKHAANYLSLMKERYEELFNYTIEIDESIHEVTIPKLIIQPICENSFNHAFRMVEPIWELNIKAYTQHNQWYIEIKDNGNGFDEEFINTFNGIYKNVGLENAKAALEKIEIGGLSLPNIYMRLKLVYGDGMIFELRNDIYGATVIIGGVIT